MKSIIRFLVVVTLAFSVIFLWRSDRRRAMAGPPKVPGKVVDPQEEVLRALRPLKMASPRPAWSHEAFQERFEEALKRNDPCLMLGLLREEGSGSPQARWAAGMAVLVQQAGENRPVLEELFASTNSPLLGGTDAEPRSPQGRFFQALLLSNQLQRADADGERGRAQNAEMAVALLKELSVQDPENGAYPFFLTQALRQIGAKKEEVQAAYVQASKAARFDAFYQGLYDDLLRLSYENMASFAWVYTFLPIAASPNFGGPIGSLRYWAADNDTGKWVANRLAKRLIDLGAKYKAESPGYLYSQQEYVLGYNLRYQVADKPKQDWADYVERMKEARDFISETPPAVGQAEMELYTDLFEGRKDECRWSSWQALYEAYRAKGSKVAS